MENYKPNEYEEEIDLIELFWKLVANIKWMIIFAVIFAVLVGCGKYALDIRSYNAAVKGIEEKANDTEEKVAVEDLSAEEIVQLFGELTASEMSAVDSLITQLNLLEVNRKLYDESVTMHLDPINVKKETMSFIIDSENSVDTIGLADIYRNYFDSDKFVNKLITGIGASYDIDQIQDLISRAGGVSMTASGTNMLGGANAVIFRMYLADDMDAEKVIATVKAIVDEKHDELNSIKPHTIVLADENQSVGKDEALANTQNSTVKAIKDKEIELYKTMDGLSAGQTAYLNYKLNFINTQEWGLEIEATPIAPTVSKKFILLGFVFGVFVVCAWVCVQFIFSVKLSSADKFVDRFGGVLFGEIATPSLKNRKKKVRSIEDQIKTIVASIVLCAKQNNVEKLAFIGSDMEHLNNEYLDSIKKGVEASGIIVTVLSNIYYNPDDLMKCAEIEKAVVFEGVDISIYNEISNEIVKANEYKIGLLGSVIL